MSDEVKGSCSFPCAAFLQYRALFIDPIVGIAEAYSKP